MRRVNSVISGLILVLAAIHAVLGGYQMAGLLSGGKTWTKVLAWSMAALVLIHALIGIFLTIETWRAAKKSGCFYWKENKLFLVRRVSGLALIVFLLCHVFLFGISTGDTFRLRLFEGPQLFASLGLILSLAVHLLSNLRPLAVGIGSSRIREFLVDLLILTALILFVGGMSFVIYYLRWNIWWR